MSNQDFTEHWPARCLRLRSYDHMALQKFDYSSSSSSSSSFFVARSEDSTNEERHRSWGLGVPTLSKYAGGVRVCFDPPKMSQSFIQNCCWITLQVSHHEGWKTRQKWKVKLIFRGSWNSFAYCLRQIYATASEHSLVLMQWLRYTGTEVFNTLNVSTAVLY